MNSNVNGKSNSLKSNKVVSHKLSWFNQAYAAQSYLTLTCSQYPFDVASMKPFQGRKLRMIKRPPKR